MFCNQPNGLFPWHEADAMFLLLTKRAHDLRACRDGSPEQEERDCVTNAVDAYEAKSWPRGLPRYLIPKTGY